MYHSLGVVALAADDLRHGQLHRLFGLEHDGVPLDFGQKVIRDLRDNWCCSNLLVLDVQACLLQLDIREQ